jgi:hypothetical protein
MPSSIEKGIMQSVGSMNLGQSPTTDCEQRATSAETHIISSVQRLEARPDGPRSSDFVTLSETSKYPCPMMRSDHRQFLAAIREAAGDADRDGTAALNGLVLGGGLMVASSVALVGVGGPAGMVLWALIWAAAGGGVALWLAPHVREIRSWHLEQAVNRRAFIEAARQRAVDLLLRDDTAEPERRAAAALLDESDRARDT